MPKRKREAKNADDESLTEMEKIAMALAGGDAECTNGADDSDSENEYWHPVQIQAREVKKWESAVDNLRQGEFRKGRVEVRSAEPKRTEWARHVTPAGDMYFWHSELTGSTWDDPTQPVKSEDGSEYLMVLIPDRAVPGMLLCVDVPDNAAAEAVDKQAEPSRRCWTPMRVPEGSKPGMVYRLDLQRLPTEPFSWQAGLPTQGSPATGQPAGHPQQVAAHGGVAARKASDA
jgi:hypothetical protein